MKTTPMLLCDAYKLAHREQYPQYTTKVFSTWTPRDSRIPGIKEVVFFGLQATIKKYLIEYFDDNFFRVPLKQVIQEYKDYVTLCLGEKDPEVQHIVDLHNLGFLPLKIKALPEGTVSPIRVPQATIENTDPRFFWLTNFLETLLSCELWHQSTCATIAKKYREILESYALLTVGNLDFVQFQGHDFSMRGHTTVDSAIAAGAAHLTSFVGSDTVPAVAYLTKYYNADPAKELVGTSVKATEHSVMCAHGQDEIGCFRKLLNETYPAGIVSVVSDTWDLWEVVAKVLPTLKDEIMGRDGKLVVRPDCYDDKTEILTDRGWVFFKDLQKEDLVAQVLDDGTYEFIKPLKYVEQDYSGIMHRFRDFNGKMDMLVTPNHRMICIRSGREVVVEASSMPTSLHSYTKFTRSAKAKTKGKHLSALEKLKIAFQADGSYTTKGSKIRFSFAKKRKMIRLEAILEEAGITFKKYNLKDGRFEYHVHVNASDFKKDFSWVALKDLDGTWCEEFIEELSYWDANRRSDFRFKFDTIHKDVIEVVSLIALSAGYGCLVSKYEDNRKDIFSDLYTAHIMKDNKIGGQAVRHDTVEYTGKVYCVQVPTGRLLVRRAKSTLVCGNSGAPADILCGDPNATNPYAKKGLVECLWDIFGGTMTPLGYKLLDSHIGAIYGDSITLDRCEEICARLAKKGFASINVVMGIGSYTYQYLTRDTFGYAMKATYVEIDGKGIDIFKDPATDPNKMKKSQKGRVAVVKFKSILDKDANGGVLEVVDQLTDLELRSVKDELVTVFEDGELLVDESLANIRARLRS